MRYLPILVILLFVSSCDKGPNSPFDFDTEQMLESTANDIIIPRYSLFNEALTNLETNANSFNNTPTLELLESLRGDLYQAQLKWQACSYFEFGPAESVTLKTLVNTYPTDTQALNSNIAAGVYDLYTAQNIATKGLPALDYLLNGVGNNDTEILAFFQNNNARAYLHDVIEQLVNENSSVLNTWTSGYASTFASKTGTDLGSALGMMVNAFNADYEQHIRDGKVGIPLGVRSLGTPLPQNCEAYYSQVSSDLALESITQFNSFLGGITPNGSQVLSFYDYLDELKAGTNNELLSSNIKNQFELIETALSQLNEPMETAVINETQQVQDLYSKMQQLVVYLKVDLSSAMGILITYQDNDGD